MCERGRENGGDGKREGFERVLGARFVYLVRVCRVMFCMVPDVGFVMFIIVLQWCWKREAGEAW